MAKTTKTKRNSSDHVTETRARLERRAFELGSIDAWVRGCITTLDKRRPSRVHPRFAINPID